ncbi:MAG: hypothetical protein M3O50_06245 [Myxococcota bacterium]|nr:hypothetical protein [Myxococcota bacterium]
MPKLILLSIVLVSVALPIRLSARVAPRRALRLTQWIIAGFVFVWAYMCVSWYPQLVPLD